MSDDYKAGDKVRVTRVYEGIVEYVSSNDTRIRLEGGGYIHPGYCSNETVEVVEPYYEEGYYVVNGWGGMGYYRQDGRVFWWNGKHFTWGANDPSPLEGQESLKHGKYLGRGE